MEPVHYQAWNWSISGQFIPEMVCLCVTLLWRHNGCDGVSNHQPHDCLLNHSFRRRSKKTSKLRVTGLCGAVTGEFPAQMACNEENVSISWRHHEGLPRQSTVSNDNTLGITTTLDMTLNAASWCGELYICSTRYTQFSRLRICQIFTNLDIMNQMYTFHPNNCYVTTMIFIRISNNIDYVFLIFFIFSNRIFWKNSLQSDHTNR